MGVHALGVENAAFLQHKALLNARGFFNELHARMLQGLLLAPRNGIGMAGIVQIHIAVKSLDQLGIGDRERRLVQPGASENGRVHRHEDLKQEGPCGAVRQCSQGRGHYSHARTFTRTPRPAKAGTALFTISSHLS